MRAEKAGEHLAGTERSDNEQRCRGWRDVHGDALIIRAQFLQRANWSVGVSDHLRAGCVGLIFARAGNSELQKDSGDWSNNDHEERGESAAAAIITASAEASEYHSEATDLRQESDRAGKRRRDR